MKKSLIIIVISFCYHLVFAQKIYENYIDGQIYVKFSNRLLKGFNKDNPENLNLSKFGILSKILKKHFVYKASKPYYQANNDAILSNIIRFDFKKIKEVDAFISELKSISGIEYAEKVPLMKIDIAPNDFSISSASVHLNQINAQNAWNIFNGNSNIVVAIVDNAVMWSHSDLVGNTFTNTVEANGITGVDDDGNGYIDDVNGYDVADNDNNTIPSNNLMDHGTHCAGIAGARNNNGIGIASIGWNIKILPVKCTSTSLNSIDNGYGGIIYAVKAKARVISCSWGGSGFSITEQSVINYAWNNGCIVIAAAGNNSNNTQNYPGAYANSYCVANVDANNVKATSSSYGTWVDICAPGQNIYSTIPNSLTGTYGFKSGTSMATPMVAGLAGLMLSTCSYMTPSDVLNCISNNAVNVYSIAANSSYSVGNQIGIGRIEAYQAMLCAASFTAALPVCNFYSFPRNSCPNTLINFIDSSLYQPTSWTWAFQNGSPATSTLSNPLIQWNSPGVYAASLTVSNANGNNSINKLSYITINGPISPPLNEGFESIQFLPNNWTANNILNDNMYWERKTGFGAFGTSTACVCYDNYNYTTAGTKDEMRTPKYIFSNVTTGFLKFDVAYERYDAVNSDTLEVKLSNNCGANWTTIYLKGGLALATGPDNSNLFVPTANQWRTDSINISSLTNNQGNVMFSFINHGQFGQPIYLDNINLSFPTPSLSINTISSSCSGAAITMTNLSISANSYSWSFPGGNPAVSSATNPIGTYSTAGIYTVNLFGLNGTSSASISRTISISNTTLNITANPTIMCPGNSATISVTGASSYSWNTGSLNSNIVVSPTVTSSYSVTGYTGNCNGNSVITISITQAPSLSLTVQPSNTICLGGTVILSALGNYTNFVWANSNTNNATIAVTPSTNTTYTIFASGSIGNCNSSSLVTIQINTNPFSILSTTNSYCENTCTGILTATTSLGMGPYAYSLINGSCSALPCYSLCAGLYQLITTDLNGCKSNNIFSIGNLNSYCVGIKKSEFNAESLIIFPNPIKNELTIDYKMGSFNYKLFSSLGQLVREVTNNLNQIKIDMNEFEKGIYFIEIEIGVEKIRKKLILE